MTVRVEWGIVYPHNSVRLNDKQLFNGDTITLLHVIVRYGVEITYDSSGVYVDTLQTITGCDSILTLDLTINGSYLEDRQV